MKIELKHYFSFTVVMKPAEMDITLKPNIYTARGLNIIFNMEHFAFLEFKDGKLLFR